MERYGRNLNTEQRRQYFAKEKKLLRAMCENPDTHNIARAQNEAEVLMKWKFSDKYMIKNANPWVSIFYV